MELDALILADAASTPGDGKFYVHGGGLTRYEIGALPAQIPLGVLIRLKVTDEDATRKHRLNVALIGPMGVPNVAPAEFIAVPPEEVPELLDGEEHFLQIALQIPALAIREGLYRLELHIDGELLRSVPLPVLLAPDFDYGVAEALAEPSDAPRTSAPARRKPSKRKRR